MPVSFKKETPFHSKEIIRNTNADFNQFSLPLIEASIYKKSEIDKNSKYGMDKKKRVQRLDQLDL